jgi:uncharacterized protein with von Willebrand factor type A (vWA) domain
LTILTKVLDDHCRNNGIDPSSPECEDAARLVMALFTCGARRTDELKAGLNAALVRDERKGLGRT